MSSERPLRILQVVYVMHRGGVETLLMNIIRRLDRNTFRMDIAVRTDAAGEYDPELRAAGVRIFYCAAPGAPLRFAFQLYRLLKTQGPYDAIHSHMHALDGLVMLVAALAGARMRISHSHNISDGYSNTLVWRVLRRAMRILTRSFATHKLAVSQASYRAQFGCAPDSEVNSRILLNGVDLERLAVDRHECRRRLRQELGVAPDARLLGHVGRFHRQKNHRFLLESFARLVESQPDVHLVLAGSGALLPEMRDLAGALGIAGQVHFLGSRSDVAGILSALDVFVLPSLYEGFGIVLVEAQACGVPCLVSSAVPPEADAALGLIRWLPLSSGVGAWAETMRDLLNRSPLGDQQKCLAGIRRAGFDIGGVARQWEQIYVSGIGRARHVPQADLHAALD